MAERRKLEDLMSEGDLKNLGFTKAKMDSGGANSIEAMVSINASHCLVYLKDTKKSAYKTNSIYDRRIKDEQKRMIPLRIQEMETCELDILIDILKLNDAEAKKIIEESKNNPNYVPYFSMSKLKSCGFRIHNRFLDFALYTGYEDKEKKFWHIYFLRRPKDSKYEVFGKRDRTKEYQEYLKTQKQNDSKLNLDAFETVK